MVAKNHIHIIGFLAEDALSLISAQGNETAMNPLIEYILTKIYLSLNRFDTVFSCLFTNPK